MTLPIRPSRTCERARYARSIYLWTLSQWDENRADIERRTATVALDALLAGERVGIPVTSSVSSSVEEKMGFF
ncbi:hypothetical protein CspeluHIS016_0111810 [Cutaneotrichosporon spelunceum]|uniref:Uncharacterized protein n=1 Tax=Cutaneotrichosporon spelunceum TaxID=1672016 RepID=A0AAD3TQM9_9TREE|nr:hypothetical protein CspeluHIS016_0111810 [Cutaneotrichosporon spelunceum]